MPVVLMLVAPPLYRPRSRDANCWLGDEKIRASVVRSVVFEHGGEALKAGASASTDGVLDEASIRSVSSRKAGEVG